MAKYTTIEMLKKQIYVDDDSEDDYLGQLLEASEDYIQKALQRDFTDIAVDGKLPASVSQAILIEAATLYANREAAAPTQMNAVPYGLMSLIIPYIKYS
jgi:uncharacterized phage protein (predicted DNA packaging)